MEEEYASHWYKHAVPLDRNLEFWKRKQDEEIDYVGRSSEFSLLHFEHFVPRGMVYLLFTKTID
jgi:hypothetical protein